MTDVEQYYLDHPEALEEREFALGVRAPEPSEQGEPESLLDAEMAEQEMQVDATSLEDSTTTVESIPDSPDDAWGLPRDEWISLPVFRKAFGVPRRDHKGLEFYDCRECEAVYGTLAGLLMHRNRQHISEEFKAERSRTMSIAQTRSAKERRDAKDRLLATYAGEDPEVQEILKATLVRGSTEADARRKRWYNAEKNGMTEAEFQAKELERAIAIASGQQPSQGKRGPRGPEAANKAWKRRKLSKQIEEAQRADDLFARIGAATDLLFPDGVRGADILVVAELQKNMLALLQGDGE